MQYRNLRRQKTRSGSNHFTIFCALFIVVSIIFGALTFGTNAEEKTKTWYVPEYYPTIQDAVEVARSGDIIEVNAGVYVENIQINKSLILRGINHPIVDANTNYYGFDIIADGVTIEGFTLSNAGPGELKAAIRISSNNNIIKNNIIQDNVGCGVVIYEAQNNHLSQNLITRNNQYGLRLWQASENSIDMNAITDNNEGIYIENADQNALNENTFSGNNNGIKLAHSNDTLISRNIFENNNYAIQLDDSHENNICENTINHNIIGIYGFQSHQNTIEKSTISSHKLQGIRLEKAEENTIHTNTVQANKQGIYLFSSQNNMVYNNYVENSNNAFDDGDNQWNCALTSEENIIGGPNCCGNYWDDYSGSDGNYDGIGEIMYSIEGGANQDVFPLVSQVNYAPSQPKNPQPATTSSSVDINTDLSWTATDIDDASLLYNISFGETTPPPLIVSKASSSSFDPGTLQYETVYYWQITAIDSENCSTTGEIWSFTTASPNTGSGGGGGGGGVSSSAPQPPNPAPTAEIGGPYAGFAGFPLQFDASKSSDDDAIQSYQWEFGDGIIATGPTPTHSYASLGIYEVRLTVTDTKGKQASITTEAIITNKPNNPPSTPSIEGSTSGTQETKYSYSIVATDEDQDQLHYTINWGDGTTTKSEYLDSNIAFSAEHKWTTPGRYSISVQVTDGTALSENTVITLIDAHAVKSIGYLFDSDENGRYDLFYCTTLQDETIVGGQKDTYYLDLDNNDLWDYQYNSITEELSAYAIQPAEQETTVSPFLWIAFIITLGCLLILIGTLFFISREHRTLHVMENKQSDFYSDITKRIDTLLEEHERRIESG